MDTLKTRLLFYRYFWWDRVCFSVLKNLAKLSPPLPKRTTRRFRRSAAKRDPKLARRTDVLAILTNNRISPEFSFGRRGAKMSHVQAARALLRQCRSGIDPRKPELGFNPYIFAEANLDPMSDYVDPYLAFLRSGRPDGPWMLPAILGDNKHRFTWRNTSLPKTALHIHAYYLDQLPDICSRLMNNSVRPDLFVSVRSDEEVEKAGDILSDYAGRTVSIQAFPNRGRDIAPFLTGFGARLVDEYALIGHIHTKRSLFSTDSKWVTDWVELTRTNTIGSVLAGPMLDRILKAMCDDPSIGVIYPEDPHIPGWGENIAPASELAKSLGVSSLPKAFNFPVGTMFWMRSEALAPFVELELQWSDYPDEPLSDDGTMLHALERLFGAIPTMNGWKTVLTHTRGVNR